MQKIRPDMDFGRAIERIRRSCGLSQKKVVDRLWEMGIKMSSSSYAKIETNRLNIRASELVALKLIFNVSFDDFFADLIKEVENLQN